MHCTSKCTDEIVAAMRLIRSEGLGVRTFHHLIEIFGTASKALENVPQLIQKKNVFNKIQLASSSSINKELDLVDQYGAEIIYFKDRRYPALLKSTHSFPPILTIFGHNKSLLENEKIAIVGSRNSSTNSSRFAYKIAKDLGSENYVIVSGLARGIDSYSHMGALESGTIAVIAGGINHIYPNDNKDLYKKIAETGLIISENAFNAAAKPQNFPQRNRIVSGLSIATIVVEASLKSGSLITANFAVEQNREVFAVPGFPLDTRYSGTNLLIKQGAYLFENIEDVMNVIKGIHIKTPNTTNYQAKLDLQETNVSVSFCEKDILEIRDLILSKLSTSPTSIDTLIEEIKISRKLALLSLVEMELEDIIQRSGNSISLVA